MSALERDVSPGETVLRVDHLTISFPLRDGTRAPAVRDVSLSLARGQVLGIVGESGSGKTMLSLATVDLVPEPGRITGGSVEVCGAAVQSLGRRGLRRLRGGTVGFVFQDPMAALNPVRTIGAQVAGQIRRHQPVSREQAKALAVAALEAASIPHAADRMAAYPHQLSGGLRQRVMIAAATANDPALLIADEPTTALDATVQAQIVELLRAGAERRATVLVTHDLGLAAAVCTDIMVMYAGRILEQGPTAAVLGAPRHPYTRSLLEAMPRLGRGRASLVAIGGQPPALGAGGDGCPFQDRCPEVHEACTVWPEPTGEEHRTSCWTAI